MIARLAALALALAPQAPASDLFWSDWDRDGDLDALVVLPGGTVRLLANEGPAGFVDGTAAAGLNGLNGVSSALWGDFDHDGLEDLVLVGSGGVRLLKHDRGVFADVTGGSGLEGVSTASAAEWMDTDGDGALDLHVESAEQHVVFVAAGGGVFEPRSLEATTAPMPVVVSGAPAAEEVEALPGAEEPPRAEAPARRAASQSGPLAATATATVPPPSEVPPGGSSSNAYCFPTIGDATIPGACLEASSVPALGRLYPLSTELFVDAATGYVGVGNTSPSVPLEVNGGSSVSNSMNGGYLRVGPATQGLLMDEGSVQGSAGGSTSGLNLNPFGGDVSIGDSASAVAVLGLLEVGNYGVRILKSSLYSENTSGVPYTLSLNPFGGDVELGDGASSEVFIGAATGPQLRLGRDELQAQYNARLHLNPDGGNLTIGNFLSTVDVPGTLVVNAGMVGSMELDGQTINARFSGSPGELFLNNEGGDVHLGKDLSSRVNVKGVLTVGPFPSTPDLIMDSYGIQAEQGGNPTTLRLNPAGGQIQLGGFTPTTIRTGPSGTKHTSFYDGRIEVRTNSSPTVYHPLLLNPSGGDVGVGTSFPIVPMHVDGGGDASLSGGGYVQTGPPTGLNLVFDDNEIMARNNGGTSELALNYNGGNVRIGDAGSNVYAYGKMGAGTSAPDVRVHAVGGSDAALAGGGYVQAGPSGGYNIVLDDNELMARHNGSTATLSLNYDGGLLQLGNASSVAYVRGNLGVGTSVPSERLHVSGNVRCNSLIQTSDARYKREVRDLESALEAVLALRGVSYEWDPVTYPVGDPGRKLGFLAQEVLEVLPEAVVEAEDGFLSVSYSSVVPVLVEAVAEQQASIDELRTELAELRGLLAAVADRAGR